MDVNQWLMKYWQICEGEFSPRNINWGFYYEYAKTQSDLEELILSNKYKTICLNDASVECDFEMEKKKTIEIFEKKFPEKCSFEKD